MNNLPKVGMQQCPTEIRTSDLSVLNLMSCCNTVIRDIIGHMKQTCVNVCPVFLQRTLRLTDDEVRHWKVECGKPLMEIHSSAFCDKALLSSYCELLRNVEVHFSYMSVNIVHKSELCYLLLM